METNYNPKPFMVVVRIGKILTMVLAIIMYLGAALALLGAAIVAFVPESVLTFGLGSIDTLRVEAWNIRIALPIAFDNGEVMVKWLAFTVLLAGAVYLAFIGTITRFMHGLFTDVSKEKPFSEGNVKRLFNMSYWMFAGAVILPVFSMIAGWQFIRLIDIAESGVIYSLHDGLIMTGALVWILASVFRYGKHLQDEVDQTV